MRRLVPLLLLALVVILPTPPFGTATFEPFSPPSTAHWFGTDDLGRDLLAGVVEGARLSLVVGFGTAALAFALGALVGITAGILGGAWDELLMRIVEVFQIVPRFFLALVVMTIWGYDVAVLILVLGLTSWSGLARIARAETLSLKEREFVLSARSSGAGSSRIVGWHILPNAVRPLLVATPLIASGAMLTEAGLAFLGLGTLDRVSWGYLLQNAQAFLREAWWMAVFPGAAMTLAILFLARQTLLGREELVATVRATGM